MLTPRENALEVINWGNPEYVPFKPECNPFILTPSGMIEEPWAGGVDAFGVKWIATKEGSLPEPGKFMFDDIAEWRNYVKIPDLDQYDFKAMAEKDLARIDRNEKLINVIAPCGLFERLISFMGFENGLSALLEDPESCMDFFHEMAKFKVDFINRVIDAYQPDMITYADDLAHARGLFMSPETYRTVLKPYHKMIADAITSRGVIFCQHMCGKCEDLVDDLVEMGCKLWNNAQTLNDIAGILQKYKGKLAIEGGWDSAGPAAYIDATLETVLEEGKRCVREYGVHKGYIFTASVMNERGNGSLVGDPRLDELVKLWPTISRIY